MDINKVRARFQYYRQQIRELQRAAESSYFYLEEAASRAERRAETCRIERLDAERQVESDRWYREDELRRATKDLERADSYGDEWGKARALQKLKQLA